MYKHKLKIVALVVSTLLLLMLAACGSDTAGTDSSSNGNAGSDDSIKIGMVSFLSGAGAPWANSLGNAGELAVQEINENGGVMGKPVQLIINDSNSDPATGNVQANSLIERDEIVALFTADTSATRNALYPIINQAQIPFFYTLVYEGEEYLKYMYVNGAVPKQIIEPVIPYLVENEGANSWYIIGNDYVFPQNTAEAAKREIEKLGGTIVGEDFAPMGTSDFSSILAKIDAAKPDFILQILVGSDAVSFLNQFDAQGLHQQTKILGVAIDENSVQAMGSSANGIFSTGEYFQSIDTPENVAFTNNYKEVFGENADLQSFMSIGIYEAIHMWALAANKAQSLDWEKIDEVIGDIVFEGPRGAVQYETETNHASLPIYLTQVVNGELKIVESFGIVEPVE
ncbi:substrate-binding protein [Alkalihalobacterium alkalinitrilicum]|uniref:substrate-binding protein n=1 Tax=Alkalihalobacterium alkalinitrilicum TaxID=427920 RepID=UPI000995CF40|nr:substrate-binding protein [Alkalihalobacterium alkalinitrilicum]